MSIFKLDILLLISSTHIFMAFITLFISYFYFDIENTIM